MNIEQVANFVGLSKATIYGLTHKQKISVRAELHSVPIPISNYWVDNFSLNPPVHAMKNNGVPLNLPYVLTQDFFSK